MIDSKRRPEIHSRALIELPLILLVNKKYHLTVANHKDAAGHPGAERMLRLGLEKLGAFPDVAYGVAVGRLRGRVAADVAFLSGGDSLAGRPPPQIAMGRA